MVVHPKKGLKKYIFSFYLDTILRAWPAKEMR